MFIDSTLLYYGPFLQTSTGSRPTGNEAMTVIGLGLEIGFCAIALDTILHNEARSDESSSDNSPGKHNCFL